MLTAAQREARKGKITASRVGCLMRGDRDEIFRYWEELTGQREEDDLSRVWVVRLGERTEELNLDWYEIDKSPVTRRGEVVVHPFIPWAACTLDGWIDLLGCPIQAKHVSGREPFEITAERYTAQLHWEMSCTGATQAALSVIRGNDEPRIAFMRRDLVYSNELLRRATKFYESVQTRTTPVVLPPAPPPQSEWKDYDMSGHDEWRRPAAQWLQVQGAIETAKDAEKILKAQVPDDARKAWGCGVRITRDSARRLYLRADKGSGT